MSLKKKHCREELISWPLWLWVKRLQLCAWRNWPINEYKFFKDNPKLPGCMNVPRRVLGLFELHLPRDSKESLSSSWCFSKRRYTNIYIWFFHGIAVKPNKKRDFLSYSLATFGSLKIHYLKYIKKHNCKVPKKYFGNGIDRMASGKFQQIIHKTFILLWKRRRIIKGLERLFSFTLFYWVNRHG